MECELCKSQKIYVRCFDCLDLSSSSKLSIILCQECDALIHPLQQPSNEHQQNPQQSQLVLDTSSSKSPSSKSSISKNNLNSSQPSSAQKIDKVDTMMCSLSLAVVQKQHFNTQHLNHDSSSSAALSHTSSSHSSGYGSRGGSQQAQSWRSSRPSQGLSHRNLASNVIQPSRTLHMRSLICSECEERDSHGYCEDCEQFMCQDCSKTIHNKGARRRHVLDSSKMMQLGFCDEIQARDKQQANQSQTSSRIPSSQQKLTQICSQENFRSQGVILSQLEDQKSSADFSNTNPSPASSSYSGSKVLYSQQSQVNDNLLSSNKKGGQNFMIGGRSNQNVKNESASYSSNSNLPTINQSFLPMFQPIVIEQDPTMTKMLLIFRDQAQQGNLLLLYENLIVLIADSLKVSIQEAREIVLSAEQKGYLITTVRQFGRAKTLTLVSMRLGFLSLESLLWVLKSLQLDEMAPNERAVQSRVKEAFGIKIHQYLWEVILDYIFKEQDNIALSSIDERQMSADLKAININFSSSYLIHSISSHSGTNSLSSGSQDQGNPLSYEFKYVRQYDSKLIEYKLDRIVAFETEDNTQASQKTFNLFLQGQLYEGLDQIPMKDLQHEIELYQVYKKFLEDYFMGRVEFPADNQNDEILQQLQKISLQRTQQKLANSSSSSKKHSAQLQEGELEFNEDGRAITGGRYGCAQFVKVCGPELMRLQSLGRLAQMVQRSINEDYLRYQKTLLVLTELINKDKDEAIGGQVLSHEAALRRAEKGAKLQTVKQAIIEVLAEQKGKVQLPQLPNLLRKKLPFKLDYNQLGFAKLKDLISTMSNEIKLELIGPNHTLAYLILSGRYHHENGHSDDIQNIPRDKNLYDQTQKNLSVDLAPQQRDLMQNLFADGNLQLILNGFYQMLMENPFGIESNLIVSKISKYLGKTFDLKDYGCHSLYEFIKKFVMPTIDLQITNNKPDVFVIRSTKILAEHQNQNFNRSASHSSQSLGHSNSQSSISSQSFALNQNISPSNHTVKQPPQNLNNTITSSSQQILPAPNLSTGRKIGNSRNANNQIHSQSFQGLKTPQVLQKSGLEQNQMYLTNYGFSTVQGPNHIAPQNSSQLPMPSVSGNQKQNLQVQRGTQNDKNSQIPIQNQLNQIRGSVGNQDMIGDLKRVPSSQLYIPGPSSFYGRANTSQTNTHLNVSHFKDAFDGENSSVNQALHSQVNFPNNRYHQYHMSYDQFTLQKRQLGATNPQLPHPHLQSNPQQINRVGTIASGMSGGSIQPIPEMQLNHRINHSYGGGPILQRNFLQYSHLFERPFSVDTHNEQRSRSNSPHHNKTISYFNMGSANSSCDFSTSQLQHLPLFQTQLHSTNFNPQVQSLQVHQEESRESSLGASDINSNKEKIQAASTDLQFDPNDDAEGLGFHSERIEDLLEDYNEDTATNLKSVEELSIKTTLVHSHQLSKGSMSHILPSGSFISGQNQANFQNQQANQFRDQQLYQSQISGMSPYSRGGDEYEDQMLLLHQAQQQHLHSQQQAMIAQQQYYQNLNMQFHHQNNLLAGGGSPAHYNIPNIQQQHYKALSEDFAAQNFKNQFQNSHSGFFFQDQNMNQIPLRLNQQQRIQQFIPQGFNQHHQQQR